MASAAADRGLPVGHRRILLVGGKGGVGKTTIASSLALRLAHRGERCLVVSTDPAHSLGDLWDRDIGDAEVQLAPNLVGLEIDPERQVERHLDRVTRSMREFARPDLRPEIDRQMELARLSPGMMEAAILERMADLMIDSEARFDRIVFDTAPTGHTLRLLSLPEIMGAWTEGLLRQRDRSDRWSSALGRLRSDASPGRDLSFVDAPEPAEDPRARRIREVLLERRRKFARVRRLLLDPETAGFILVMVPEKLPILESRKAADILERFDIPVLGLVVNRVLPGESLGQFLEQRRTQESVYLRRIDQQFPNVPSVRIPLLPRDVSDEAAIETLGMLLLP